ncbi:glycoside hydrolase family 16 protein [Pseudomonas capeferrum]|uniref:glycoside hydrolase family 16 protein n=1 Tax=Pseudomonas capeferrum TaxID=1495066 RepID=UPI0015E3B62E|nr:glycoside hydrolase family 16 protein [Pseudomonas capeferrum]MBA1204435.1 glycoside hydrolase family 16 protein [Pseudomonas capeferrum]
MKNLPLSLCLVSMSAAAGGFSEEPLIAVDFSKGQRLDPAQWSRTVGVNENTKVFYTDGDRNITHQDGTLILEARHERLKNPKFGHENGGILKNIPHRDVSSASIISVNYFTYGKFEVIAAVPESPGLQPAIWLQGKNKGQYGEIDIMEAKGNKNPGVRFSTIHSGPSSKELKRKNSHTRLSDGFHKYAAEWTPDLIKIFHDDILVLQVPTDLGKTDTISPLNQPMQLKINIGGGSRWSGPIDLNQLPQQMQVKSIKVWGYSQD